MLEISLQSLYAIALPTLLTQLVRFITTILE
jgi:hypothetical protein